MDLRRLALDALALDDPAAKVAATRAAWAALQAGAAPDPAAVFDTPPGLPGRPARPLLVAPGAVPHRTAFTVAGRAAMLHAVAHIEFNAIKGVILDSVTASIPSFHQVE